MFSIVVHGGAGPKRDQESGDEARASCLVAADQGAAILAGGGSALDAVEAAARWLEDDPLFNAGLGAVLNADGEVELDASVMNGETLEAGAVAVVKTVKNPVSLARLVMERSPHVLLVGEGADAFARTQGVPAIAPGSLVTPVQRQRWLERDRSPRAGSRGGHGTIGAVAVDERGQVAAATSTGGTAGKLKGRVGDSPLIGAGTVADSRWAAASSTGLGEFIIRVGLARSVLEAVRRGAGLNAACEEAVAELKRIGGDGGVIAVTPSGEVGWAFCSERMAGAFVKSTGDRGTFFD
ncbi:MAG: isoaspartyl peptidase/L-asparaginase [Archangium sp.]|nr:isoaspartyl peptidase/L-asparaginase [Archangium sp.]